MSLAERRIEPAPAAPVGSEARRALIATAIGLAFGLMVALFSRRETKD